MGRQPGEVLDVRIEAELKGHRSTKKYVFYPKWIVNYPAFKESKGQRYKWIENAVIRDWYPLLLKGQDSISVHLILESDRWDHKEMGEMKFNLQVISSKKDKWIEVGRYSIEVIDYMFQVSQSHTVYDGKIERLRKL
jgi:hypothetical protein